MARHNKKRNVGLIYEQLIYHLSKSIVENDESTTNIIKNIIHDRFRKGTELYKEFRLFNALVKTNNSTEQLAFRIIDEAKKASLNHNANKLDREKSLLIRDINHKLNDKNFYNKKIENYQVYASAQQLFNSWRSTDSNISQIALHESTIQNWLMREGASTDLNRHVTQNVNDLTVSIMQEKLQARYGSTFSDRQAEIIRLYCEGKASELKEQMTLIQKDVKVLIEKYQKMSGDQFLLEKVTKTRDVIIDTNFSHDIDSVSRIMMLDQLTNELKGMTNV